MVCWGVGGAKGSAKRVLLVPPGDPANHAGGAGYEIESLTALSDVSFVVRVSGLRQGAWVTWTMLADFAVDGARADKDGADGDDGRRDGSGIISGGGRKDDINGRDDDVARRRGDVVMCTRCLTPEARFITISKDLIFGLPQHIRLQSSSSLCIWNIHPNARRTLQRDGASSHGLGTSRGANHVDNSALYHPIKVSVCTRRCPLLLFIKPFVGFSISSSLHYHIVMLVHLKKKLLIE